MELVNRVLNLPTEINFYKCHSGGAVNGDEGKCCGRERSWQGGRFSAGASNQISLMKWIYGIQPDEPEATASLPMLPKTALLAVLLWLLAIS